MGSENEDPVIRLKELSWFHDVDRHTAESLLLVNNQEGAYLLRPSRTKPGEMAISFRCKASVKHVSVVYRNKQFYFGLGTFDSMDDFVEHFENQPWVAGESGGMTRLQYPLPNEQSTPSDYETIRIQGELGRTPSMCARKKACTLPVVTKEGYLTKIGAIRKSWRRRWFVLHHWELKYFKDEKSTSAKGSMDLRECSDCDWDNTHGKDYCFRLVFPMRTFYMYAERRAEAEGWVQILRWVLTFFQEKAANDTVVKTKRNTAIL